MPADRSQPSGAAGLAEVTVKRARQPACDRCHRLKTRCIYVNGASCRSCIESEAECVFPEKGSRRVKGTSTQQASAGGSKGKKPTSRDDGRDPAEVIQTSGHDLPPRAILEEAATLYFTKLQQVSFLHRTSFERALTSEPNILEPILLFAMCAFTSRASELVTSVYGSRRTAREHFTAQASRLILDATRRPSIRAIQALYILSQSELGDGHTSSAQSVLAVGMQIACALGLHQIGRLQHTLAPEDATKREEALRTWYAIGGASALMQRVDQRPSFELPGNAHAGEFSEPGLRFLPSNSFDPCEPRGQLDWPSSESDFAIGSSPIAAPNDVFFPDRKVDILAALQIAATYFFRRSLQSLRCVQRTDAQISGDSTLWSSIERAVETHFTPAAFIELYRINMHIAALSSQLQWRASILLSLLGQTTCYTTSSAWIFSTEKLTTAFKAEAARDAVAILHCVADFDSQVPRPRYLPLQAVFAIYLATYVLVHFGDGAELTEQMCKQGIEIIKAMREEWPIVSGWLRCLCDQEIYEPSEGPGNLPAAQTADNLALQEDAAMGRSAAMTAPASTSARDEAEILVDFSNIDPAIQVPGPASPHMPSPWDIDIWLTTSPAFTG